MAQNAKDLQLRELKDLVNELRETTKVLKKTLEDVQKEKAAIQQERDNFKEQVDYLTKKLFGSSSEKGACDIPGQMNLFNEAEAEAAASPEPGDPDAATGVQEETETKQRRNRSANEERFNGIPVKKVMLEPDKENLVCSKCGSEMVPIGTEFVRRELKIVPARATVIEYYSVNYACKGCTQNGEVPAIVKGKDVFRTGEDGGYPIIIYKYSETRAGDTAVDFLEGFDGYLMCDGYSGYNKVKTVTRLACWAHIRRYLIDTIPKGKQLDYAQPAVQGVMYTNQLFDLEDEIRNKYKTFDAIKEARLKQEKPIIEGFLSWLKYLVKTKQLW